MEFPKDFTEEDHQLIPNAKQWLLKKDNEIIISIVGGGYWLNDDGVNTFEMWDFKEDFPRSNLTISEINNHLKTIQ